MKKSDVKLFKAIPTLTTSRLTLRKIAVSDLDDVYEYSSDPQVSEYLLWSPHRDRIYTRDYLFNLQLLYSKGRFYDWGIELHGKMIGTVGFTSFDFNKNEAEIGYVLNPSFWHSGIAYESVMQIIEFGFDVLKLDKIIAKYMSGNDASKKLAKRVGMHENEGSIEIIHCKGKTVDVLSSAITREEYEGHHN